MARKGAGRDNAADSKKEISVFREDAEARILQTRAWICSDRVTDDCIVGRIQYEGCRCLIHGQMKLSGRRWEEAQQKRYIETGQRSYQLWEAYERRDSKAFLRTNAELMFRGDRRWELVEGKTELKQLELFLTCSRQGATEYELVECRNRRPPYSTIYSPKDAALRAEIMRLKRCTCDLFTEQHIQFHGDLARPSSQVELKVIAIGGGTDTLSTERHHSKNERRARFRVWSHTQDLPSLSTWHTTGVMTDPNPFQVYTSKDDLEETAQKPASSSAPRRRLGPNVWKWRVFLHMEAGGARITAARGAELSARFRNLPPERDAFYTELGESARIAHAHGAHPLGNVQKARRLNRQAAKALGAPVPLPQLLDGAPTSSDAELAIVPLEQSVPDTENSPILRDAHALLRRGRADALVEENTVKADVAMLAEHCEKSREGLRRQQEFGGLPVQDMIVEAHPRAQVLTWRPSPTTRVSQSIRHVAGSSMVDASKAWREKHYQVLHKNCT